MAESAAANPRKVYEALRVLEDGDLVVVHGRVRLRPELQAVAVVHLFRFVDGRIDEMWDIAQPEPAESPNKHGMF